MTATGDLAARSGHLGSFYGSAAVVDRRAERPEPVSVVIGRADHGVTRLATSLVLPEQATVALPHLGRPPEVAPAAALLDRVHPGAPLHLHVTDDLLGPAPATALRAATDLPGGRLTRAQNRRAANWIKPALCGRSRFVFGLNIRPLRLARLPAADRRRQ